MFVNELYVYLYNKNIVKKNVVIGVIDGPLSLTNLAKYHRIANKNNYLGNGGLKIQVLGTIARNNIVLLHKQW